MSTSTVGLEPGVYLMEPGDHYRHWNGTNWSLCSTQSLAGAWELADGPRCAPQAVFDWRKLVGAGFKAPGVPKTPPRTESDPNGRDPHAPGAKLDAGKLRPWLCLAGFPRALSAVADVTTKGAIKYTPNGWQEVPDGESRYMEAFGRHMFALARGEQIDADTGCLHKAQMAWNLLASLELELRAAGNWNPTL